MAVDTTPPIRRHELGAELGAELRRARLGRGLGLRAAARRLPIDHAFLGKLERGVSAPRGEVAEALIEMFEISPGPAAAIRAVAASVDAGRAERAAERERAWEWG